MVVTYLFYVQKSYLNLIVNVSITRELYILNQTKWMQKHPRPSTPRHSKHPALPRPCATRLTAAINTERCLSNVTQAIVLLELGAEGHTAPHGEQDAHQKTITQQRVVALLKQAIAPPPVPSPVRRPLGVVGRVDRTFRPVIAAWSSEI